MSKGIIFGLKKKISYIEQHPALEPAALENCTQPGIEGALEESSCGGRVTEFNAYEYRLHMISLFMYQRGMVRNGVCVCMCDMR